MSWCVASELTRMKEEFPILRHGWHNSKHGWKYRLWGSWLGLTGPWIVNSVLRSVWQSFQLWGLRQAVCEKYLTLSCWWLMYWPSYFRFYSRCGKFSWSEYPIFIPNIQGWFSWIRKHELALQSVIFDFHDVNTWFISFLVFLSIPAWAR